MKLKKEYTRILTFAKKIRAIRMLGGKCQNCGDENIYHLTYHHIDKHDKEIEINLIRQGRWSIIEKELKKCILLCHNCHNEIHKNEDSSDQRFNNNKKLFLEFKNVNSCSKCGYDKYNGSLHFHHEKDKNFSLNRVMIHYRSVDDISYDIISELNKCVVLCANCHFEHHFNDGFFEDHKEEIYKKAENMRENTPKIDRELVRKMYFEEGKRQIDIVKHFGCKKGTISDIIKNLRRI